MPPTFEEHKAAMIDHRSDPLLSGQRYDEIIDLRTLLLDIRSLLRGSQDPDAINVQKLITERAKIWGTDKDCA
jgi:hypothetical protein